ncbi:uncharacterized protein LOC114934067 [Nylanderia fulva]|uniref:uncharacterized protein LOC114934067 n=1 Tax=Nylanderia fulva TaxID=613905 RepID=UPI0010FB7AD5|nr:uncharacterized protein LOC114934067 [Nylanderia fulva]XP_029162519.1 uncharacterized protein LOC114934067 [Nylanderia fulva]XP_029162520.1 uncharacterized protein LOC114934067 [Nylanderia fulva]
MSNSEEPDTCVLDTQEINKGIDEDSKKRGTNESQNASWNESQDFRLVVEGDESMTDNVKLVEDKDINLQKSDSQQIANTSQTDDKTMAAQPLNEEIRHIGDEKAEEAGDVTSEIKDSDKKDELSDEDEIIQATPPQNHSPSRKGIDIATSLKRKAGSFDEPPAKIARTISVDNVENPEKQPEEEESHQSGGSDDSYQDLFKNMDKHEIIEETQDPSNQEFAQNSLASSQERATIDNDKTEKPRHSEQAADQSEEVFSEKCCNAGKDENLNVSSKLTDVSANDSILVNANSINESDLQVKDHDLSTEAKRDADSTLVTLDEKSATETLEERSGKVEDMEASFDESNKIEQTNCTGKTVEKDENKEISSSQTKLRSSVELIYEGASQASAGDDKKLEVVQIDEDEKTVDTSAEVIYDGKSSKQEPEVVEIVDESREENDKTRPGFFQDSGEGSEVQTLGKSSFENKSDSDFSYKESMKESSLDSRPLTDSRMVNGSLESKKNDNPDQTLSVESDTFSCDAIFTKADSKVDSVKKLDNIKSGAFVFRDPDNIEIINLSDNDTSNAEEKSKSEPVHNSAPVKTIQMEREIGLYVRLKCTIHVDESTKECVSKELTAVHCEPAVIDPSLGRQKNEDSQSTLLADISDNKDSPPGSVNSNPQLYQLNPRLSIMSSISSSSSALSSAAALNAKIQKSQVWSLARRDVKKSFQDSLPTHETPMTYDRVTREWKNHQLLTSTVLSVANTELFTANISGNVDLMDPRNHLQHLRSNFVRSSTPEEAAEAKIELTTTPKSTKKGKAVKRPRSKMARSNQTGNNVAIANAEQTPQASASVAEAGDTPSNRKKSRLESTESKDVLANSSSSPSNDPADELIGKSVFAKWSDNNYYPGRVSDRLKTKYKVNFYDGKSKTLIPDFVIPIPKILRNGLSVYATTNDYGCCGIIVDSTKSSSTMSNGDQDDISSDTYYTVETDDGERLRVQMQDIFLLPGQAQVLKEEVDSKSSLPSTPKVLGQVTLDNMVDGKRRSKRIGTPGFSTPKSKGSGTSGSTSKTTSVSEPSVSGVSVRSKDKAISENEGLSSGESNVESADDELALRGVQREITGTYQKGPQSRIKGRKNRKNAEDPETVAKLGPIPPANSNIFKGMSFILTCLALKDLDRNQDVVQATSGVETEATDTDTENEEDWNVTFDRDRLHKQILAGGGKIYEEFEQIPPEEYKSTKLITNVPNRTTKSILCLSVNIPACNHKWIIRCCSEGKIVSAAENALPTGWSFQKNAYVETFQTSKSKPLSEMIVIIPNLIYDRLFVILWEKVCENAGAVVLIAENLGSMEAMDFDNNDVVVVSNRKCPSWAVDRANHLRIPILSTMWVTQCLIEGKRCPHDQHPRYRYNYMPN